MIFRGICPVIAVVLTVKDGETVLVRDLIRLWGTADAVLFLSGVGLSAREKGIVQHPPCIRRQSPEIRLGNVLRPMRSGPSI